MAWAASGPCSEMAVKRATMSLKAISQLTRSNWPAPLGAAERVLSQVEQARIVVDTGGTHHDVDPQLRIQRGHHRGAFTDVHHRCDDIEPLRHQAGHRARQALCVAVHRDDPKAIAGEALRSRHADTLRCASHKCDGPVRA